MDFSVNFGVDSHLSLLWREELRSSARDLFDYSLSIGTIQNRVIEAVEKARKINQSQDLSSIDVALLDELFQGNRPVLTGVDADSTYCFLLEAVEHRDEDTWGWYLLEAESQGLNR